MLNWDINNLNRMQDEMIKQAEKDHLAQDVMEETRKANLRYSPTLVWFGRQMMDFGSKLVQISGGESNRRLDTDREALIKPDIHLN